MAGKQGRRGVFSGGSALWLVGSFLAGCSGSSGSGGSGGYSGPSVDFNDIAVPAMEGTVAEVGFELNTKGPLETELVCKVREALTGTAAPGIDYTPVPEQLFVFPAGTLDGSVLTVSVEVLQDPIIEGAAEMVELELLVEKEPGVFQLADVRTVEIQDDDFALVRFTTLFSSLDEDRTLPERIDVELEVDPGKLLGVPASITVAPSGDGTAKVGDDYRILGPEITFVPGGPATASVEIEVLDDDLIEGDESIVLGFTDIDPGLRIESGRHQVTVVEDDLAPDGLLEVRLDPSGTLVAPDAELFVGGAPGALLDLRLGNVGLTELALNPLTLTGDTRDFRISIADGPLTGTGTNAPERLASRFVVELTRTAGEPLRLALEPVALPFSADAVVLIDGEPLATSVESWLADLTLWRGSVEGVPDSSAFLGITPAGPTGWVELAGERLHVAAGGQESYAALTLAELGLPAGAPICRGAIEPLPGPEPEALRQPAEPAPGAEAARVEVEGYQPTICRLAVETDDAFSQRFASTTEAGQYAALLFAAVAEQFRCELQTDLTLEYLGLYSANDPWTSPDEGGDVEDLLREFQEAWREDGWPVEADLAHIVSGKDLGGGYAYIDVLCDTRNGFGASSDVRGRIDWAIFDGTRSPLNWDYVVVAHELGHGLGSRHTHEYCPPLDRCEANCDGVTECPVGTVMSYCHNCAGSLDNIRLDFHAETANAMRLDVGESCLDPGLLETSFSVPFRIEFAPTTGPGQKRAVLYIEHDSPYLRSPFRVALVGTSQ